MKPHISVLLTSYAYAYSKSYYGDVMKKYAKHWKVQFSTFRPISYFEIFAKPRN